MTRKLTVNSSNDYKTDIENTQTKDYNKATQTKSNQIATQLYIKIVGMLNRLILIITMVAS